MRDYVLLPTGNSGTEARAAMMNAIKDLSQNHFLAALSANTQHRLLPDLKRVELTRGMVLYGSGEAVRHVYFPIDTLVSLLNLTEDGSSTEVAVVGNDGFVGVPLFTSADSTLTLAQVQSAGYAYQLSGQRAMDEFQRDGEMRSQVLNYIQALITQVAQMAVCNRHHSIDQHLSRWLLLALDRLPTNHLVMTHERIAHLLGVRREGITSAAHRLQVNGVIQYRRGRITVLDRPRLERLSCECYAVVKRECERLAARDLRRSPRAYPANPGARKNTGNVSPKGIFPTVSFNNAT